LVKAGLLPDLALPGMIGRIGLVRRAVTRPSDGAGDPLAALAAAMLSPAALPELVALQYSADQLAALLREAPGQAALPIRQGLVEASKAAGLTDIAEARLAIVVDQFEELFTIDGLGEAERDAFVAALATLAKSGLAWVVATMRSDFFDRIERMPALAALSAEGRYLLLPPDDPEIGQIIRQPAQEAGLRFEHDAATDVGLDEVMRQAARDSGALPLLSFLLDQLWQRRNEAGILTFAAYRELGGLEGAVARRAEEVFHAQPEAACQQLPALLRELVTIEGGRPLARAAPLSRFAEGTPLRRLVDAFLAPQARLMIGDGDAGRPQFRLAHEALLTHWPRAREQIAADMRDLELRGRLEIEAGEWRRAPRREKKARVRPAGLPLAEARALLARWGAGLPAEIREFIAASRRAARRRRLRLCALVAGTPASLALAAVAIWAGTVWYGVRQIEAEMGFVHIPPGCFAMGSRESEAGRFANEGPQHQVCLKAFELAQVEVTQGEWRRVMIFPNTPAPSYAKGDDRLPVEDISWNEARRFVRLMSLFGRRAYRLPSEAEWEYAARAGTTTSRYWGDNNDDGCAHENIGDQSLKAEDPDMLPQYANCNDGFGWTAPVGSLKPNPWGLYDMAGNVENWVEDCYVDNYGKTPTDGTAYGKDNCAEHVLRGGSFDSIPAYERSAFRNDDTSDARDDFYGLRLARTSPP
jgi:formylglycine-generating enzyme required for sulfatase activity